MKVPKKFGGASSVAAKRSPNQEKDIAKKLGGKVVRGSGRGSEKGDVRITGVMRVEAKVTSNSSFSVTKKMIAKIEKEAMSCGEVPAMIIEFLGTNGKPQCEVAVIPVWALNSLIK